ncbi:hypothetical protein FMUND_1265 [Fusarium mundagurra]|uniref:PD-(D/E)XK nuclease-like domain-containing protein n=1 Tax=Fusarium mundagurra TaxID=1567541 RepID=A0A8H6DNZ2_9HYPO|nr:hypothetical protein FMUND_1265 [Fusarium mundagurra]
MVDFCVYADSTQQNSETVRSYEDFCRTTPTRSVNHTDFQRLQTHPIVLSIETKAGSNSDAAELQIGVWHAAQWAFLKSSLLRAQDGACSIEQQNEKADQALSRLRFIPAVIVQGHRWLFVLSTRQGQKTILWKEYQFGMLCSCRGALVSSSAALPIPGLTHHHFGGNMDALLNEKLWASPHIRITEHLRHCAVPTPSIKAPVHASIRSSSCHPGITTTKMGGTTYAMMEAHFKAKTTQVEPPKEDLFEKHEYARRSAQEYDEGTKVLKFQIYDNFDNAAKIQSELWDLLHKETVLEQWDVQGLFLMTSLGEVFDALDDERLLKCFKMPTLEEFLDRLMPLTASIPSTSTITERHLNSVKESDWGHN